MHINERWLGTLVQHFKTLSLHSAHQHDVKGCESESDTHSRSPMHQWHTAFFISVTVGELQEFIAYCLRLEQSLSEVQPTDDNFCCFKK